jgi:hypothetical protein
MEIVEVEFPNPYLRYNALCRIYRMKDRPDRSSQFEFLQSGKKHPRDLRKNSSVVKCTSQMTLLSFSMMTSPAHTSTILSRSKRLFECKSRGGSSSSSHSTARAWRNSSTSNALQCCVELSRASTGCERVLREEVPSRPYHTLVQDRRSDEDGEKWALC